MAAHMIREILINCKYAHRRHMIVVEHDLAFLDYLSDYVCVMYGTPGCTSI